MTKRMLALLGLSLALLVLVISCSQAELPKRARDIHDRDIHYDVLVQDLPLVDGVIEVAETGETLEVSAQGL